MQIISKRMRKPSIIQALLLLLALTCTHFAKAQDPCEITCSAELPICSETPITLSVPNNYLYTYRWSNGKTTNSITVKPFSTTTYDVRIFDQDSIEICHPSIRVDVLPRFTVKFRQVKLTCSNNQEENGRNAQMIVAVDSTGPVYAAPFIYKWDVSPLHIAPGDDAWAIGLEAYRYYKIKITDGRGCAQWDSVSPKAYPNPIIDINTLPEEDSVTHQTEVYLQNPHVTYSFENLTPDSVPVSDFYWILNSTYNITSTDPEPRFTYVEVGDYTAELKVYNPQSCDTSYFHNVKVNPVKLKIPNVFTPNGDGINDYFIITADGGGDSGSKSAYDTEYEYENFEPLSRYYESTELTVFNRWGRIVYHSKDYQNNWDGGSLSDGTYFYVLKCHGLKQDVTYQGSVSIVTAQRTTTN